MEIYNESYSPTTTHNSLWSKLNFGAAIPKVPSGSAFIKIQTPKPYDWASEDRNYTTLSMVAPDCAGGPEDAYQPH